MPESKLKPMDLRMLRTSGVREEFNAPELERLLGGEGVDLSMTDQPEAFRVRLEAGLEVLDRRILAGIKLALGRQAKLCGLAGVVLGIIAGAWWALALPVATGGAVLFGPPLPSLMGPEGMTWMPALGGALDPSFSFKFTLDLVLVM